jgi:Mrp family chromosome partitioning ATPase
LDTAIARSGKSVILADLDLGAANLPTCFGVLGHTPTIKDFILSKVLSLENIIMETPVKNLNLMSGAEFVSGVTNPAHFVDCPTVLRPARGSTLFFPVQRVVDRLSQPGALAPERKAGMIDSSDEKREKILRFIDSLGERVFSEAI